MHHLNYLALLMKIKKKLKLIPLNVIFIVWVQFYLNEFMVKKQFMNLIR